MEFLRLLLLFLHLCGLAILVGSFAVQFPPPRGSRVRPPALMLNGSLAQLVTGVCLVGIDHGALDRQIDDAKMFVKLAVLLVIVALILVARRRPVSAGVFSLIGLLAVGDVGVAIFWT